MARELWIEISPRSFNVRVKQGLALTQLMVFMPWDKALKRYPPPADLPSAGRGVGAAGVSMDVYEESLCFDQSGEPIPLSLHKGAVVLSVCVPQGGRALSGYEALQTEDVIDLRKVGLPSPCYLPCKLKCLMSLSATLLHSPSSPNLHVRKMVFGVQVIFWIGKNHWSAITCSLNPFFSFTSPLGCIEKVTSQRSFLLNPQPQNLARLRATSRRTFSGQSIRLRGASSPWRRTDFTSYPRRSECQCQTTSLLRWFRSLTT